MTGHSATTSSVTCPSEASLDRYELEERQDSALRRHIDFCEKCQDRLRRRKAEFLAMPRRNETLEAIVAAVTAADNDRADVVRWEARPRRRWLPGLASAAAVGLVAVVLAVDSGSSPTTVRTKGGVGLSVYVERNGRAVRSTSGDRFGVGERIRFEVDLAKHTHIMIVGQQADGLQYNAFPVGREARSQPFQRGVDQVLPGAVVLDASLGRETLYLVSCDAPFGSGDVRVVVDRVETPTPCQTDAFVLLKVEP